MSTESAERLKILAMLEEGKITAGEHKFLRIQVTDMTSGAAKVNVTVPMGLVGAGLRMAERFAPDFEGFDMQELQELLASGVDGKLIEVMDEQDNERVEIYVE